MPIAEGGIAGRRSQIVQFEPEARAACIRCKGTELPPKTANLRSGRRTEPPIFSLLSQSLEAVEGVALVAPPPLYTAVLACQAKKNTNAQSANSSAQRSVL